MAHSKQPDYRSRKIMAQVNDCGSCVSDNSVDEAFARYINGEPDVPREIKRAYSIYCDGYKQEVVEAFILAGASNYDVEEVLEIDQEVIEVYRRLFFEMDVFKDRLDLHAYVEDYTTDKWEEFGRRIKKHAVHDGLVYLKVTFGENTYEVPPERALKESVNQSYLLSKSGLEHPIDSDAAKEARQWTGTMVDLLETIPEVEGEFGEDDNELEVELLARDKTNKKDVEDEEFEIVHESDEDG